MCFEFQLNMPAGPTKDLCAYPETFVTDKQTHTLSNIYRYKYYVMFQFTNTNDNLLWEKQI